MQRRQFFTASVAAAAIRPRAARAQAAYPDRPVRIVVGFAAGGPTDIMARRVAERLTQKLGQPFLVENRTGAAGTIAAAEVARARPDGHALIVAVSSSHAIAATLMARPTFDPVEDFAGVAVLGVVPMALAVHPGFPARSFAEFLAVVRAKPPGHFAYGTSGAGGISHFTGELLMRSAGVVLTQVPYRGASAALQALIAGQVPIVTDTLASSIEAQRAGQLRILATFAEQRSPVLPDTPTAREEGLPEMVANTYNALLAPAMTPGAILQALNQAVRAAMAEPDFQAFCSANMIEIPQENTPESAIAYIRAEREKWRPVIRATGMRME